MDRAHIVLRFSSLGDVVLSSAFSKSLKQKFPDEQIYVVCAATYANLKSVWPIECKFVGIKKGSFLKSFRMGFKLGKQIQRDVNGFRIWDLQGNLSAKFFTLGIILSALLKKKSFWVSTTKRYSALRNLSVLLRKDLLPKRWVYQEHQNLLGTVNQYEKPELKAFPGLKKNPLQILCAVDARHWKKKWPERYWAELLRLISRDKEKLFFVFVGSENSMSSEKMEELRHEFPSSIEFRFGDLDYPKMAELAATSKLCLSGNSAWQHIAESVGTPVLSLAGPIVDGFGFAPFLDESKELFVPMQCRPCTKHGGGKCYQKAALYHGCMELLTPLLIKETLFKMLGRNKS